MSTEKYTYSELKKAVKFHIKTTKVFKGYLCNLHKENMHDAKCHCEEFIRNEIPLPLAEAVGRVKDRIDRNLPIIGHGEYKKPEVCEYCETYCYGDCEN